MDTTRAADHALRDALANALSPGPRDSAGDDPARPARDAARHGTVFPPAGTPDGPGSLPTAVLAAAGVLPDHIRVVARLRAGRSRDTWAEVYTFCDLVSRGARPADLADLADALILPSHLRRGTGRNRGIGPFARLARVASWDGVPDGFRLGALEHLISRARRAALDLDGAHAWLQAGLPPPVPGHPVTGPDITDWSLPGDPWLRQAGLTRTAWRRDYALWAGSGHTRDQALLLLLLPAGHPDKPTPERLAVMAALRRP